MPCPTRAFRGTLILWYFQFPAGINQSRVADQFPAQGNDFSHGAAVLSGDFPEGVALSDDVYPTFLILRQNSIGSAACDRCSALGNLKLPAGVDPVRVLDPVTVGCHDLGYGAVVFSVIGILYLTHRGKGKLAASLIPQVRDTNSEVSEK